MAHFEPEARGSGLDVVGAPEAWPPSAANPDRLEAPDGWFAVATSSELARGAVAIRRLAGYEIVLFRTASGAFTAVDPFCPHMGAHLGHGATVVEESLRCPLHHFRFGVDGRCHATGSGAKPPAAARLRVWPSRERNGILLVFHSAKGAAPDWEPPELDERGWTATRWHRWSFPGHPQETTENSVDYAHFRYLHGYAAMEPEREVVIDGASMHHRYAMTRSGRIFGREETTRVDVDIHVHGLGYSLVETSVTSRGVQARHFVLATPTEPGHIDLLVGLSVREIERPARVHPALALVPRALLTALVTRRIFHEFVQDVEQDVRVWRHKRFVARPALSSEDGPIAAYRRWARTQYSVPAPAGLAVAPARESEKRAG